jgi:hypothetical protein
VVCSTATEENIGSSSIGVNAGVEGRWKTPPRDAGFCAQSQATTHTADNLSLCVDEASMSISGRFVRRVGVGLHLNTECKAYLEDKERLMKNFLAVFTGTAEAMEKTGWNALSESARQEQMQAGLKAWHAWMEANQKQIVVSGGPVGKTKRTSGAGVENTRNNICGYIVVSAESHEDAARLFEGHPHFSIFPGEAVEVMECLPVPGA